MPVTPTYPGVYIEELPSGVHTITGVATSIAAFVGWAPQGPTDQATLVLSWADFQRQFGGLDSRSLLGYAVNQFFMNGGQQAYIIRLVDSDRRDSVGYDRRRAEESDCQRDQPGRVGEQLSDRNQKLHSFARTLPVTGTLCAQRCDTSGRGIVPESQHLHAGLAGSLCCGCLGKQFQLRDGLRPIRNDSPA